VAPIAAYGNEGCTDHVFVLLVVEICEQKNPDLTALARKTKVILTTVGPYALYGEPVVQACVEAGTHYLDVLVQIFVDLWTRQRQTDDETAPAKFPTPTT
jgi:short subunit dehydrogenase-like uncharacterized protein